MSDNIRRVDGKMIDTGLVDEFDQPGMHYERGYTEVLCCGVWIDCRNFTNTCTCGADYNMSGQMLAPRGQWGEETGESIDDILGADLERYEED